MRNEHELKAIFHESNTIFILGAKGAGKTNFVSELMRLLVYLGYEIYTNIHFFSYEEVPRACTRGKLPKGITYLRVPESIHVVHQLSDLLYGLLKPGKKVVFIDEAGIVSPTGISSDTKTIQALVAIIRHFDCAYAHIAQLKKQVSPSMRKDFIDFRLKVIKCNGGLRKLEIGKRKVIKDEEGEEYITFPLVDTKRFIPKSKLPYDGDFPSTFKIDIDLKKAMDEFGKVGSSLELEDGKGKEILDRLMDAKKKPMTKKEQIETMLSNKDEHNLTHKQIAKIFGTSKGYVDQVSNKLKDAPSI